ncbi:LPS export ABC transporter permease LptG, partial [Kaarinaea lacus]
LVLGLLLSLFAIFSFLDELNRVGRGNYTTTAAIQYVSLLLPGLIYQLFPIAALLGCTIGLGIMASHNELTIMRAAGVSLNRIIWSVMRVGLVMVVLTLVIGESVAPVAEQYARTLRSVAISDKLAIRGKSHLWARDGDSFVNVRDILPGERLANIYIYDRDGQHRISRMVQAKSAAYRDQQWVLEDVLTSEVNGHQVKSTKVDRLVWDTSLSPDLLGVVTLHPGTMSVRGLYQYIGYLNKNGLDATIYRHAMWAKIVAPLVTGVMVFLAIPFVFGPLRSVGVGHRILVGALAGIGFYLLNQMFSYMGIVYNFNPVVVALLPTIIVFGLAYWMLSRVR